MYKNLEIPCGRSTVGFFYKVFSLLFLNETCFLSCYYAEHSKIVQDEMEDGGKMFSERS